MATANKWRTSALACLWILLVTVSTPAQNISADAGSRFEAEDPLLQNLMDEALSRNPGIRQSFALYQAALQKLPQVSSLPDPMLSLTQ
jgi:outer membrane protein TolC